MWQAIPGGHVNTFGLNQSLYSSLTAGKKMEWGLVVTKSVQVGGFNNSWSVKLFRLFLGSHFLQQCGSWEVIGTSVERWAGWMDGWMDGTKDWLHPFIRWQGSFLVHPLIPSTNESTQAPNFFSSHSPAHLSIDWIYLPLWSCLYTSLYIYAFIHWSISFVNDALSTHLFVHPCIHWYIERCKV